MNMNIPPAPLLCRSGCCWTLASLLGAVLAIVTKSVSKGAYGVGIEPAEALAILPLLSACLCRFWTLFSGMVSSNDCEAFALTRKHFASESELKDWVQSRNHPFVYAKSDGVLCVRLLYRVHSSSLLIGQGGIVFITIRIVGYFWGHSLLMSSVQ